MSLSLSAAGTVTTLLINISGHGSTAEYVTADGQTRTTNLYCGDYDRAGRIKKVLPGNDVAVLLEAFCTKIGEKLVEGLEQDFPHVVYPESGHPGLRNTITAIHQRYPKLASTLFEEGGGIVDRFTAVHVGPEMVENEESPSSLRQMVLGAQKYIEDPFVLALTAGLRRFDIPLIDYPPGVLFMSKYEILDSKFISFPEDCKAEWERFIRKGLLHVTVSFPSGPVDFVVAHHQDGTSPAAIKARQRQISMAMDLINGIKDNDPNRPVNYMADFNTPDGTDAHAVLRRDLKRLGLVEAEADGATFKNDGVYQKLKNGEPLSQRPPSSSNSRKASTRQEWKLDYSFFDSGAFELVEARVLRNEFRWPEYEDFLSDHFPLRVRLRPKPLIKAPSYGFMGRLRSGFRRVRKSLFGFF